MTHTQQLFFANLPTFESIASKTTMKTISGEKKKDTRCLSNLKRDRSEDFKHGRVVLPSLFSYGFTADVSSSFTTTVKKLTRRHSRLTHAQHLIL